MKFAERLLAARVETGLTQAHLVRRARISQSRILSYEKGRWSPRNPPAVMLDRRCDESHRQRPSIRFSRSQRRHALERHRFPGDS
jgi:predicted transcriptional regulator